MKILVINGPNINMLGLREPNIYGDKTYEDLINLIENYCISKNIDVNFFQSNYEGDIITKIQEAYNNYEAIVINPAGYTHTSVAILDALKTVNIPTVEVHISDISLREKFRQHSYISYYAIKTIKGEGFNGYLQAIDFLIDYIN